MNLKLKTNRNDLIKWWIPPIIIIFIIFIVALVEYCFMDDQTFTGYIIFCSLFLSAALIAVLVVKFCDRMNYLLTPKTIQVFKRKKRINQINVEDIVRIKYVRLNCNYIWQLIRGVDMLEGDACQMYVGTKNGDLITLGCFSTRDAKKIKKLYGDLVKII